MVKQRVFFTLTAILMLLLTACGAASGTPSSVTSDGAGRGGIATESEAMEEPAAPPNAAPSDGDASGGDLGGTIDDQQQNAQNAQANQRKIIYTAGLVLEVDDPRLQAQALYGMATRLGGFVSSGNVYEYDEDDEGNPIFRADMQLRVPAERFIQAQEELRGMANEVVSEQVDTEDVTAQYTDVEARIRNMQRLEEELQLLLAEARERSDNMEEVLNIYRELSRVRGDIEALQGQMNVLSDLVALATINVTLVAPEVDPIVRVVDETWDPGVTAREAMRALTEDMQGFVDGAIWFALTGLPRLIVLAIVLLVFYLVGRRVWKWISPMLISSGPSVTPPPSE